MKFNENELYPLKKYTFGNSSTATDFIAAVNFSSATFIDSYVVVSYVYKSFDGKEEVHGFDGLVVVFHNLILRFL